MVALEQSLIGDSPSSDNLDVKPRYSVSEPNNIGRTNMYSNQAGRDEKRCYNDRSARDEKGNRRKQNTRKEHSAKCNSQ